MEAMWAALISIALVAGGLLLLALLLRVTTLGQRDSRRPRRHVGSVAVKTGL